MEYLVALADCGQFSEAAQRCAVSQPALSKQVREVEEALGVRLFERARPRAILTAAGAVVVDRARDILARSRELADAAQGFTGTRPPLVRLGVIPTVAPYGLPGLLVTLRRRFPDVAFAIRELQTLPLLDALRAGEIDAGLLARPFDASGLSGPDLVNEPFVLVAPNEHALDRPTAVSRAELVGTRLLLMEDGHCLRDQALDVCALAGRAPGTAITAASVTTLVRMVESGLGATLLPASALCVEVREGHGLVARSFGDAAPGRTLTLQWRSTSPHAPWFSEVSDVLRAHYLSLNAVIPSVAGPRPQIVAVP